jgi:phage tail tape-measure protein
MSANPSDKKSVRASKRRHVREAEGGAAGAVAGATMGSVAGPPGAVVGAVIGGVVGAAAAAILDENSVEHSIREKKLDDAIGVTKGAVGAPNLKHPPERNVAFAEAEAARLARAPVK